MNPYVEHKKIISVMNPPTGDGSWDNPFRIETIIYEEDGTPIMSDYIDKNGRMFSELQMLDFARWCIENNHTIYRNEDCSSDERDKQLLIKWWDEACVLKSFEVAWGKGENWTKEIKERFQS